MIVLEEALQYGQENNVIVSVVLVGRVAHGTYYKVLDGFPYGQPKQ